MHHHQPQQLWQNVAKLPDAGVFDIQKYTAQQQQQRGNRAVTHPLNSFRLEYYSNH